MAKRWYVVHVYSGFEKKIAQQLKEQAGAEGARRSFRRGAGAAEDVVEVRRGQKVNAERKFFPGYVLVKMELTDEGLASGQGYAEGHRVPGVEDAAIADLRGRGRADHPAGPGRGGAPCPAVGAVRSGRAGSGGRRPFTSFNGTVEEIDEEKGRLKVSVSIFGRSTPVDLEYGQVEKA